MRVEPELTYQDYKDGVHDAFGILGHRGHETPRDITNYMADEDDDLLILNSTSLALWMISIGEYEVRHNILENRVREMLGFHIPRFLDGRYTADLTKEEYKQVKADVEYILSQTEIEFWDNIEDMDPETEDLGTAY
jgi:hypothetical protein